MLKRKLCSVEVPLTILFQSPCLHNDVIDESCVKTLQLQSSFQRQRRTMRQKRYSLSRSPIQLPRCRCYARQVRGRSVVRTNKSTQHGAERNETTDENRRTQASRCGRASSMFTRQARKLARTGCARALGLPSRAADCLLVQLSMAHVLPSAIARTR